MSAKILKFPTQWIFILRRPLYRKERMIVVPFTIVRAPKDPEDDAACLRPYLENGWTPLVRMSGKERRPIATHWMPDPHEALRHAARMLLFPSARDKLLQADVTHEYIDTRTNEISVLTPRFAGHTLEFPSSAGPANRRTL